VQFSSLVTFGHAIQHSLILASGHMNASMSHQVIKECNVFIFPVPQMGSGKKKCMNLQASFSTCGIHLPQTVRFPKLLVRIWQMLAGKILTSVAISMQKILHVYSSTDFTCFMWRSSVIDVGGSTASGIIYLFWTILNGIHPMAVLYEGACVPKPSFNDL
jgi:hypothetical protein